MIDLERKCMFVELRFLVKIEKLFLGSFVTP
jgi:hypothetical protein